MYSLHPRIARKHSIGNCRNLIARIVAGAIPEAQRGEYDVNSSMFDWTEALRQKTTGRRLARAVRTLLSS